MPATPEHVRDLVKALTEAMVDSPDQVSVSIADSGNGTATLHVKAAPNDVGKLVGVNGRTARALRTLLTAISQSTQLRFSLDIEPR